MKKQLIYICLTTLLLFGCQFSSGEKSEEIIQNTADTFTQNRTHDLLNKLIVESNIDEITFIDEEIVWTVYDIDLLLTEGQTLSAKNINWDKLDQFFTSQGWKTNSIGFTYVSKDGRDGVGYLAPIKPGYEYSGAMCILYKSENVISCGWGPGAE